MAASKPKTATKRAADFRERVVASGGRTIYGNIGKDATKALEKVQKKTGYSIAGAIEYALLTVAPKLK